MLPSILNQNYENKEILIVDNGSTDGSIEFLKGFENIKIIENGKNLGYGAGKNILVKESTGEYIFMLDNDIELSDDELLNRIYEKCENDFQREYYLKLSKKLTLSKRVLQNKIESSEFERILSENKTNNFTLTLEEKH